MSAILSRPQCIKKKKIIILINWKSTALMLEQLSSILNTMSVFLVFQNHFLGMFFLQESLSPRRWFLHTQYSIHYNVQRATAVPTNINCEFRVWSRFWNTTCGTYLVSYINHVVYALQKHDRKISRIQWSWPDTISGGYKAEAVATHIHGTRQMRAVLTTYTCDTRTR